MTQHQLNKWWKEVQALADGKQIQYRIDDDCEWKDINDPAFFPDYEYRVKPEPILIPFDFSDAEFLIGKVIKAKDNGNLFLIIIVSDVQIGFNDDFYPYRDLLNHFTFLDGSPCGKPEL